MQEITASSPRRSRRRVDPERHWIIRFPTRRIIAVRRRRGVWFAASAKRGTRPTGQRKGGSGTKMQSRLSILRTGEGNPSSMDDCTRNEVSSSRVNTFGVGALWARYVAATRNSESLLRLPRFAGTVLASPRRKPIRQYSCVMLPLPKPTQGKR
jgi:hypothetical protein